MRDRMVRISMRAPGSGPDPLGGALTEILEVVASVDAPEGRDGWGGAGPNLRRRPKADRRAFYHWTRHTIETLEGWCEAIVQMEGPIERVPVQVPKLRKAGKRRQVVPEPFSDAADVVLLLFIGMQRDANLGGWGGIEAVVGGMEPALRRRNYQLIRALIDAFEGWCRAIVGMDGPIEDDDLDEAESD